VEKEQEMPKKEVVNKDVKPVSQIVDHVKKIAKLSLN
jgi:hypothetical protein